MAPARSRPHHGLITESARSPDFVLEAASAANAANGPGPIDPNGPKLGALRLQQPAAESCLSSIPSWSRDVFVSLHELVDTAQSLVPVAAALEQMEWAEHNPLSGVSLRRKFCSPRPNGHRPAVHARRRSAPTGPAQSMTPPGGRSARSTFRAVLAQSLRMRIGPRHS
ncbi:hypothetical protein ColTof3_13346 [Colletotrichum tofieldiae]|nr:hypothetical protein ColTof3_13346 [Colletotrichum tofieldiae]